MAQTDTPGAGIDGEIDLDREPAEHQPRRRPRQNEGASAEPEPKHAHAEAGPAAWTDPRLLVPFGLFLAAIFVIGLALRAGSIQPGSSPAQILVERVVSAEQRAGFSDITVRAEDSLIILAGTADSTTDAMAMGAVARSVEGVGSVDNQLVIAGGSLDDQVASDASGSETVAPPSPSEAGSGSLGDRLGAAGEVTFEPASASLTVAGTETIARVADILLAAPGVRLEVRGHTDSDGDEAANQILSQRRAEAVVAALRTRGVDESLLTPVGFGESQPIQPNITADGRAKNRRIEFTVLP